MKKAKRAIAKFSCVKRAVLLKKCEDRFLNETDINTIVKRLRVASATAGKIRDKTLKSYLRMQRQNIVFDSDSEKDESYDYQLDKGFFSESEDNDSQKLNPMY